MTYAGALLVVIGALFCALAALGMVRFPDVYTRLHAASKAGTLGAGLVLLGVGVASADTWIFVRSLVGLVFLVATAPVSAHLLARAALRNGTPPDPPLSINEYEDSQ